MSNDIKDNAPDGADFYAESPSGIDYIKCQDGNWYIWMSKGWAYINPIVVQQIRDNLRRVGRLEKPL